MGTSGLVSWAVDDSDLRLIVMWSIPYSHSVERSWLGFGSTQSKSHEDFGDDKFMEIWNNSYNQGHWFTKGSPNDNKYLSFSFVPSL